MIVSQWLEQRIGFYGDRRWLRWVLILLLLGTSLGFGYVAQKIILPPVSAEISIACAGLLIVLLLFDSWYFLYFFYGFSRRRSLLLVRRLDSTMDRVIERITTYLTTLPSAKVDEAIKIYSSEITSDFITRRPQRRVLLALLSHNMANFVLTIASFALVSIDLSLVDRHYQAPTWTYKHECCGVGKQYFEVLVHSFYYHTVIFQSLGDGNHSPETTMAQAVATIEGYLSITYLILIFGGSLAVVSYIETELSPENFKAELVRELESMSAGNNPITKQIETIHY